MAMTNYRLEHIRKRWGFAPWSPYDRKVACEDIQYLLEQLDIANKEYEQLKECVGQLKECVGLAIDRWEESRKALEMCSAFLHDEYRCHGILHEEEGRAGNMYPQTAQYWLKKAQEEK
jgi:hypothetical protein